MNGRIANPALGNAPDTEALSTVGVADADATTLHQQIADMSSDDVVEWLCVVGLEECRGPFQSARVDGDALLQLGVLLDGASFETFSAYVSTPPPSGLGVAAAGHVLKLTWQLRQLLQTGPPRLTRTLSDRAGTTALTSASSSVAAPGTAGTASARLLDGRGADAGAGNHGSEMLAALERRAAIAEAERDTLRREFEALRCSTDKDIECTVCHKLFSTPRALASHRAATGHGTDESPHPHPVRLSTAAAARSPNTPPATAVRWAQGPTGGRGFGLGQPADEADGGSGPVSRAASLEGGGSCRDGGQV